VRLSHRGRVTFRALLPANARNVLSYSPLLTLDVR
jgi:hypothetical protein